MITQESLHTLSPKVRGYSDYYTDSFINPFPYGTQEYSEWIDGFDEGVDNELTADRSLLMYNHQVELKPYTEKLMKFMWKYIKGE